MIASKLEVLIADSNLVDANIIAERLDKNEFTINIVSDASQAREYLNSDTHAPDIAFISENLGEVSGLDLIKEGNTHKTAYVLSADNNSLLLVKNIHASDIHKKRVIDVRLRNDILITEAPTLSEYTKLIHKAMFYERTEREHYEALFKQDIKAVQSLDMDGKFVNINEQFLAITGYLRSELIGKSFTDILPEKYKQAFPTQFEYIKEQGQVLGVSLDIICKNGDLRNIELSGHVLNSDDGKPMNVFYALDDLTAHNKAEEKIKLAQEIATAANSAKSIFLANMSHELRNPLNGIIGLTEILLKDGLNADQKENVELIYHSGKALTTIVNDILDFSKIEAGAVTISNQPFNLYNLTMDVMALMHPMIKKKEIEIKTVYNIRDIAGNSIDMVVGDEQHLRQVITNIVGNAVKFTDKGYVSLEVLGKENDKGILNCLVSITDTGIGLKNDKLEYIFEQFTQIDSSKSKTYQGTGLGLSISKNLVKLMEGDTIKVESEYGKGSKFYFTVPLKVNTSDFLTTQGIKEIDTQKLNVNSKYSILCVDDELVNRILYKKRLEKLNYDIGLAEDGVDAIKKVEEATAQGKPFDMIFMDINMPKLNGIEAMKKLHEKGYKIPIIAVTGYALPEQIKEFIDGGMSNVLTKPYETENLLKIINQYLKN